MVHFLPDISLGQKSFAKKEFSPFASLEHRAPNVASKEKTLLFNASS